MSYTRLSTIETDNSLKKAIVSIHELDCRPLTIDVIGGVLTAETVDVLRTHGDVPKLDGTSTLHRNEC